MSVATEKLQFLIGLDAKQAIAGFEATGDAADKSLTKAQSATDKLSGNMTKFGAGAVAVSGVVGVALFKTATSYEDLALSAGKMSDATGLTVEQSSRWIEVSKDMGLQGDVVQGALGKMSKALATNKDAFAANGVEIKHLKDGTEDIQGTFLGAIDKLGSMTSETDKTKLASQLFGRSWQDMAEMITAGSAGLKTSLDAVSGSKIISDQNVTDAKAFRGDLDTLRDSLENVGLSIGKGVMPVLGQLAAGIGHAVDAFGMMNGVTDGFLGKALSIGTVALGAAGALSFLGGKAIALKEALITVNEAGEASMSTMGAIGLAVAGAVIAYEVFKPTLSDVDKAVQTVKQSMEDGAKTIDKQKIAYQDATVAASEFADTLGKEADAALVNSIEKSSANVDLLNKLGVSINDVVAASHDQAAAQALVNDLMVKAKAAGIDLNNVTADAAIHGRSESLTAEQMALLNLVNAMQVHSTAVTKSIADEVKLAEIGDVQALTIVKAAGAWDKLTPAAQVAGDALLKAAAGQEAVTTTTDATTTSVTNNSAAYFEQRRLLDLNNAAVYENVSAQKTAEQVNQETADSVKEMTDKTQGYVDALNKQRSAVLNAIDAQRSLTEGEDQAADAVVQLNDTLTKNQTEVDKDRKVLDDHRSSTKQLAAAQADLDATMRNSREAVSQVADSFIGLSSKYADAQGHAAGTTAAVQDQISYLQQQQATMVYGGPLWHSIQDYINQLNKIPTSINTSVTITKSGDQGGGSKGDHGPRAMGGPVSADGTYLVGEQGPELFSPGTNGTIIPNNKLGGGAGMGGVNFHPGAIQVNVTAGFGANGQQIGQQAAIVLVDAMTKLFRTQGVPAPLFRMLNP